ncbi:MAG: ATP-dependent RNA helicase HrpA [Planctomycetaceae bacterium]|nr:ATP-dependent RNA helicase HrpA [Planctomycetaceae bacterium]
MPDTTQPTLDELDARIDQTMLADRHRLRQSLNGLKRRAKDGKPYDKSLEKLLKDWERSARRYEKRVESRPKCTYDEQLPISARCDEIVEAIRENQVVVVCGETGSGKSTQLPKLCLDAGQGIAGMIGHTQPRRLAARSVAARVAEELEGRIGDAVAFKIRFTDTTSPKTYIKLMTDGILLAETQSDTFLNQYDTIIIDEAHERSLNIDFLLGYLKRLLPKRPELRVIITSATIDAERFATFFGTEEAPAPVIEVSGRTYPVEVRYAPPEPDDDSDDDVDWLRASADACEELAIEGPGDILVFMPTERDIREAAKILQGRTFSSDSRRPDILPLFGRLSEKEQNRVFQPQSHRRIVIATNVAESSLTVPGIHYVVDTGTARISRFSATSQVQRLPIEAISQASANQRAGRCGRIGPGICVRLYAEADYQGRDEFTSPEILRTNLASVLLQMKALRLGKIEDYPFLDPPNTSAVRAGLKSLFELGAIDEEENLTDIGRSISRLPVDPRIGRLIHAAEDEQCLEEVLIIASALELRDPRDRPLVKQKAADEAHQKFQHESSDFLTLLKLWDFYTDLDEKLSGSKLRKACHQNFLSFNRMREWKDLHRQLREIVRDRGIKFTPRRDNEEAIHRAILTGLLSNVAMRGDANEYTGAGGQKLFVWPGSVSFDKKPKWIVAAELVETTKRYARCVAPIQPAWIERLAPHLVKHNYSDPHWHEKSACTMAFEQVLLYGLPIVPRRRCRYSHIDPAFCREQFIQHGLVEGQYVSPGEFQKQNARLKSELEEWQAKLRQGANFMGEEAEFLFYDERLAPDVVDGPRFEKWRKSAESRHPRLLFLSREDLLVNPEAAPRQTAFPDQIKIGTMQLPVEYHLEPGAEHDGVTITVPREGLNQLSEENLGWLVPGLLEEKVAALIKTLPKQLRTLFVPVPETAREVVRSLEWGKGDLLAQLSDGLRKWSNEHVPVSAFDPSRLPEHLKFHVRVVDPQGKPLTSGRDLPSLKKETQQQNSQAIQKVQDRQWNRDGITTWDFGDLPQKVELNRGGILVVAFPCLVDTEKGVSLRLAESANEAEQQTRLALVKLFLMSDQKKINDQVRYFPKVDQLSVQAMALPDGKQFQNQLAWKLAEMSLFRTDTIPRTAQDWDTRLKQARNYLAIAVQDLAAVLPDMMTELNAVRRLLEKSHPPALLPLITDLKDQYQSLIRTGFLRQVPFQFLRHYPRYLKAMQARFQKATTGGFQKDRQNQKQIEFHWNRYAQTINQPNLPAATLAGLVEYHFLIEELRVSLFAQQLRTAVPVSDKRLNEFWKSIPRQ